MKIGVLTFHIAHNYGAMLQAYALPTFLKKLGYDCEVIDYRFSYIDSFCRIEWLKDLVIKYGFIGGGLRFVKRGFKGYYSPDNMHIKFDRFENYIIPHSSKIYRKKEDLNNMAYDILIFGSDQIWNKEITSGYDPVFFCDYSFEKMHRKYVSYAASLEPRGLSVSEFNCLSAMLKSLDAVSVREGVLAESLSAFLNRDVHTVLDPTLLMKKHDWDQMCGTRICKEDYIVLYQARYSEDIACQARRLAKTMNCKLIEMSAWTIPVKKILNPGLNASPEDFLNFIKYAKLVINTSFHGTVFSAIYEVPFYYIKLSDGWDSRAISLLESLGLTNRALTMSELSEVKVEDVEFDFSDVKCAITRLRVDSMSFIKNSLKL